MAMTSAVYFKSRREAGLLAAQAFSKYNGSETTVISLDTDSIIIAAAISQQVKCPLHLYLSEEISAPGGLSVGSVNQSGDFSYASNMSESETGYIYQEFHGYLDEAKRQTFSAMNRELRGKEVMRPELIRKRHLIVVADCMTSTVNLHSLIDYLKKISYKSFNVCVPIVSSDIVSDLKQLADEVYFTGTVDFFYGKDHYFEDNSVYERAWAIDTVSRCLSLWPAPALN